MPLLKSYFSSHSIRYTPGSIRHSSFKYIALHLKDVFNYNKAFSPLVIVGVASPILVANNERVEIGGYTIQFYHKLEQLFRSYCHKNIGIFVYNPMGGVQFLYTKWVTLNGGLQIFKYL